MIVADVVRWVPAIFILCFACTALGLAGWRMRRHRKKRKALAQRVAPGFNQLVGMTTRQERNFVYQYAAHDFKGEGAIVDLGCWLGSFTVPLATGLRENPNIQGGKSYIHAYDRFVWQEYMSSKVAGTPLAGRYKEGDNFRDAFMEQVAPVADLVTVHSGDLNQEKWDPSVPIEFLLIDAMKSWELTNSVVHNFFPALRPGLSLVHHQDFVHFFTPWIHLVMYRFRQYFEPRLYVPRDSYVFACREQIPPALLEKSYGFADFSTEEAAAAFEYSMGLLPADARGNVIAARIMMSIHRGDWAGARADLENVRATGTPMKGDLSVVAKLVDDHVG